MKKFIKKNIYKCIPIIGLLYPNKFELPIIYYHDIVEDTGFSLQKINYENFKSQMKYLVENNYKTLLFSEIEEITKNQNFSKEKYVLITFDDGYISNYTLGFPLMKELNLKFNIFINTKMIEENNPDYLTVEMVKKMYDSGIVEFGSHTHSHIDVKNVTESELIKEVEVCNNKIFKWLGYHTEDFCYPFGFYTKNTNNLLSDYYKRIYTSDCKPVENIKNSIIRGRIGISTDDSTTNFENKLKGKYDVMYLYYKRINPD